jgi:glutaredoxin
MDTRAVLRKINIEMAIVVIEKKKKKEKEKKLVVKS